MYVCTYVCQMITLESFDVVNIFAHLVYLQAIGVKVVYEGYRVKVKVTRAENVQNACSSNVNIDLPQIPFYNRQSH